MDPDLVLVWKVRVTPVGGNNGRHGVYHTDVSVVGLCELCLECMVIVLWL